MINVYDFDETIYDGDSSIDFFKYALSKNKKCLFIVPKLIIAVILYLLKIKEKEYLKSIFFSFIKYFDNLDKVVKEFWKTNDKKIKKFYLKQRNKNDIIISASPEFLLKPVAQKYNFQLIATVINTSTGKLVGKNCYGEEKVNRLIKTGIKQFDKFYSDSLSDTPLSKLAKEAYIVKKEKIIKWSDYKETKLKKLKKAFFNRDFITFCAIGVINSFNGVWIAYVYSLFINSPIIAYIFGFMTSLVISYILNSVLNFKENLSWKNLYKFAINNIPNFVIQILSVIVLIDLLELPKIISYAISAIIAVPITFILVKINVFTKAK
mgnify:CR=1 FL=1